MFDSLSCTYTSIFFHTNIYTIYTVVTYIIVSASGDHAIYPPTGSRKIPRLHYILLYINVWTFNLTELELNFFINIFVCFSSFTSGILKYTTESTCLEKWQLINIPPPLPAPLLDLLYSLLQISVLKNDITILLLQCRYWWELYIRTL